MRALLIATLFALAGGLGTARADEGPIVVVELFTSQGCSSCPPADELLAELATRDDVLPLALHVDYWDYIGWADSFARPEHTERQKAYAHEAGHRTIYTPQMVVGGIDHVVGFRPMQVADFIQAHRAAMGEVALAVVSANGGLQVTAEAAEGAALPKDLRVDLIGYQAQATVDIAHGENAGASITYANIVKSWETLGQWDGQGVFATEATLPETGDYAVIVQAPGPGRVLAAYRLR